MTGPRKAADNELLIVRSFDAPPSLVFALWSDPAHLKRWMGPKGFTCQEATMDFRVGGTYRAMIESPEHDKNWFGGVYREIEQDKRLVFTFAWDNEGPSAGIETLVTITFEERGGETIQTFHQAPFRDAAARDRHVHGWNGTFDKEAIYIQQLAKEDHAA
ncbi:MAG: SRPBCC domain-containing protein [Rhodomicrobium sp.]